MLACLDEFSVLLSGVIKLSVEVKLAGLVKHFFVDGDEKLGSF